MMSRKRPSKVLDFLDDEEAQSEEDDGSWRAQGPPPAAVMEELVRQERMLRIELGRDLCGSYSEMGSWSGFGGLGPRSGDVSGDEVMVFLGCSVGVSGRVVDGLGGLRCCKSGVWLLLELETGCSRKERSMNDGCI